MNEEKLGERFLFTQAFLYALFPIIIHYGVGRMPAILYAGISTVIAGIILFFHFLWKRNLNRIFNRKVILPMIGVTLFIVIFPSLLIFTGTKSTSAINTALLLQIEILFALIICGIFFKEKMTKIKIFGALLLFAGGILLVSNGTIEIHRGDLLILMGTFMYPFGNICAKKALKVVSPSILLCFRAFFGGMTLLIISFFTESWRADYFISIKDVLILLVNGFFVMFLAKILWYEGLKRVDVTKATAIGVAFPPALSFLLAIIFFKEAPTFYQIGGFFLIMMGLFVMTRQRKIRVKKAEEEFSLRDSQDHP
ncbi:DMT family transporter [Candidatus Peregrinibacteria bacterium]|nr:DMT family transporter [Candidatus Peregrinibacteria bacterium]